ncbi:MAG: glycosyltransferase family 2 protein, partial [Cyanobacteria bacterium J06607_6]
VNWQQLFFGKTEIERRHALKDLSLRLPLRPLIRWVYMYFILGGWRDGEAGFAWCTLQGFYEYLIVLKVKELKRQAAQPAVSPLPTMTSPTKPASTPVNSTLAEHR